MKSVRWFHGIGCEGCGKEGAGDVSSAGKYLVRHPHRASAASKHRTRLGDSGGKRLVDSLNIKACSGSGRAGSLLVEITLISWYRSRTKGW